MVKTSCTTKTLAHEPCLKASQCYYIGFEAVLATRLPPPFGLVDAAPQAPADTYNRYRLRLVLQYGMAPAISELPSKFFYNGLSKNHPAVLADKDHRRVAREISKEHYDISGPSGHGSEYGWSTSPTSSRGCNPTVPRSKISRVPTGSPFSWTRPWPKG